MDNTEKTRVRRTNARLDYKTRYLPQLTTPEPRKLGSLPMASVIVPVYNEVDIISANMLFLAKHLDPDYELIVFDDCSRDGTYEVLRETLKQRSRCRLFRFSERIGKGGTIKEAIRRARGKVVLFIDADLSSDLRFLRRFLREASQTDALVVGTRSLKDRSTQGILRLVLSLGYNALVRFLFRTHIKDHQCGLKAARKELAQKLIVETVSNGFVFDTELIVLARKFKIPIKEIQVGWTDYRPRTSSLKWLIVTIKMMRDIVVLKVRNP